MAMKNKIKQLIDGLGITPYRFAQETGIPESTVYALKNNPSQFPTSAIFDQIIKRYGVKIDQIIEYVEENGVS